MIPVQLPLLGVVLHVFPDARQIGFIANYVVVEPCLPKFFGEPVSSGLLCGQRFPACNAPAELLLRAFPARKRNKGVHVIWHDDKGVQDSPLAALDGKRGRLAAYLPQFGKNADSTVIAKRFSRN